MKKVLLFVIDALAPRVFEPALADGRLPHFQKLRDFQAPDQHGASAFYAQCVSVFPSITPAATTSIVTGKHPCEHGVAGAYWYDQKNEKVLYFGADFWVIMAKGPSEFFHDFLLALNQKVLCAETLFQTVEKSGLRAASLNYLAFHGRREHRANLPLPVRLVSGMPRTQAIRGPSILCLGDLVDNKLPGVDEKLGARDGLLNRYGFNDDATARFLLTLISEKLLPELTLAYFPDNDFQSHKVGPLNAFSVLENIDAYLGQVIETWGGLEAMLKDVTVIVTGDHAQSDMKSAEAGAAIDLQQSLADYPLVPAGETWKPGKDLLVCPNLRAAQIYLGQPLLGHVERVATSLLADARVDQVIWREDDRVVFHIATNDRGRLTFCRARANLKTDDSGDALSETATDEYGNVWCWQGDLSTVDGRLGPNDNPRRNAANEVCFGDYPNAWERIEGAFCPGKSGDLWATARLGHEFSLPGVDVHFDGGSHGSLHALDSMTCLLVAGAPEGFRFPQNPRIVDIAKMCLEVLDAPAPMPSSGSDEEIAGV